MSFQRLSSLLAASEAALIRTPDFARFFAERDEAEADVLGRLFAVVEHLEAQRGDLAEADAEEIVRAVEGKDRDRGGPGEPDVAAAPPYRRVVRAFAEALRARVRHQPSGGGNLYFDARPEGVQLRAFELLRRHTPLIAFGHDAANEAVLDAIGAREGEAPKDLVVVDIGIGRASQHRALLERVTGRSILRSLHVVGVDGDSSARGAPRVAGSQGALEIARNVVLEGAEAAGIPTTFEAVPMLAEELTVPALRALAGGHLVPNAGEANAPPPFVVMGSFALHHVVDVGAHALAARDSVLRRLKAAGARCVVLVEPDTNHFDDELKLRFLYAYRHYRTVSAVLERSLEPDDAEIVWNEFFAPEVCNVITHDGVQRVERHEELARWAERLVAAGFRIDDLSAVASKVVAPDGFEIRVDGGGLRLHYENVSLVGVLRASA